jgi:hypothetical protein
VFLLLMLVVTITSHLEKYRPPGPDKLPAGFWGIVVLMIPGLPLATLLSLIACVSARRHSVKVWLDPGLHAARRASQWPASIQGVQNRADMSYLLMIAVLVSTFLTTMVIAMVGLFPLQGLPPLLRHRSDGNNFRHQPGTAVANVALDQPDPGPVAVRVLRPRHPSDDGPAHKAEQTICPGGGSRRFR